MRNKHGFTLIEMLLVLVVISVLIILVSPIRKHQVFERYELKTILQMLRTAQLHAVSSQQAVEIKMSKQSMTLGDSIYYLKHCTFEPKEFRFNKNGTTSTSFTSNIACTSNSYQFIVHIGSGHIAIQ